jgi:hypothetical protein
MCLRVLRTMEYNEGGKTLDRQDGRRKPTSITPIESSFCPETYKTSEDLLDSLDDYYQ